MLISLRVIEFPCFVADRFSRLQYSVFKRNHRILTGYCIETNQLSRQQVMWNATALYCILVQIKYQLVTIKYKVLSEHLRIVDETHSSESVIGAVGSEWVKVSIEPLCVYCTLLFYKCAFISNFCSIRVYRIAFYYPSLDQSINCFYTYLLNEAVFVLFSAGDIHNAQAHGANEFHIFSFIYNYFKFCCLVLHSTYKLPTKPNSNASFKRDRFFLVVVVSLTTCFCEDLDSRH